MLFVGLDIALEAGQAGLVSGANGIGKSSLLRMLSGLLTPYAGTLRIEGAIALADDRLALDGELGLRAALDFWARLDRQPPDALDAAMAALDLTRLADVPVRILSTGQRKRATLARVMASGADIWLLDEPANGLDSQSLELLGHAVQRHGAAGGITLSASHQPLPWPVDVTLSLSLPQDEEAEP